MVVRRVRVRALRALRVVRARMVAQRVRDAMTKRLRQAAHKKFRCRTTSRAQ